MTLALPSFIISSLLLTIFFTPSDPEDTLHSILQKADYYSEQTFEHGKALYLLYQGLEQYGVSDAMFWRVSRAYADSGEILMVLQERKNEESLELFMKALLYADSAIALNDTNSMAYTQRSIATGQIALFKGIWKAIDLVKQTKDAADNAIIYDEQNPIAHYILARTHDEVSERPKLFRIPLGLGWANKKNALIHYDRAIELWPQFILFRLDAARLYLDMDQYELALNHLSRITGLPTLNQLDFLYREEAAQLIKMIERSLQN